ncbi:hypothetical protein ACFWYW_39545 [Nonomuraea sp. NPDC059023]|uniref:hypothetical protein n=1 Tax=unclassified Nonomuraea TaxID=2593643 RepID=UPI0036809620
MTRSLSTSGCETTPPRGLAGACLLTFILLLTALLPDAATAAVTRAAPAEGQLLSEAIAELPMAAEQRAGYDRSHWRHWVDDGAVEHPLNPS